jgi:integrase
LNYPFLSIKDNYPLWIIFCKYRTGCASNKCERNWFDPGHHARFPQVDHDRRGSPLLRLTVQQLKDDGVHVTPHKTLNSTGKQLIFEWTTELRQAIDEALAARPCPTSPFVFCNRVGNGYFNEENGRAGGWESIWRGFITRVLKETQVKAPFTEHDLRAKCASDAPSLEHAKALLSHADSKLTERVYRRKPERVCPIKMDF